MDAALVTVSYRGDFELARDLCASVDAFVSPDIEHVLIVPASDAALFAGLIGGRRRLVTVEELLPMSFLRALPSFRVGTRRMREIWLTSRGFVRGWIIQQIVKLSCDRATARDVIVFADSDLVFVRPLTKQHLIHRDSVRLYRRPGETKNSAQHRRWHRAAAHLLGLRARSYFGADYIGNPIAWRCDVLQAVQARIAATHRAPWQDVLAGTPAFSEYILYGVFADYALGKAAGHFPATEDLTHASWHYDMSADRERFVAELKPHHLAVLIQSTTDLSVAERRHVIEQMTNPFKQVA